MHGHLRRERRVGLSGPSLKIPYAVRETLIRSPAAPMRARGTASATLTSLGGGELFSDLSARLKTGQASQAADHQVEHRDAAHG
jgi:hypothetical protein